MASLEAMRFLTDLGQNLRQARLAWRFSMAELAARADVSERMLMRLETGDPGVGIGNLASVLAALGSPAVLAELMSPERDAVGLSRALQSVPRRGRTFKPGQPVLLCDETGGQHAGLDGKPRAQGGRLLMTERDHRRTLRHRSDRGPQVDEALSRSGPWRVQHSDPDRRHHTARRVAVLRRSGPDHRGRHRLDSARDRPGRIARRCGQHLGAVDI